MSDCYPPIDAGIAVALLAAGRAMRFGGGKLDHPLAGKATGSWAALAIEQAGLAHRIVVTGPNAPRFVDGLAGWRRAVNPQPEAGIAGSVRIAVDAADGARALLIALADMPLITPAHLRTLAARSGTTFTRQPDGRAGVPAIIASADFDRLRTLAGDRGAAAAFADGDYALIDPADAGDLADLDRRGDIATIDARLSVAKGTRQEP